MYDKKIEERKRIEGLIKEQLINLGAYIGRGGLFFTTKSIEFKIYFDWAYHGISFNDYVKVNAFNYLDSDIEYDFSKEKEEIGFSRKDKILTDKVLQNPSLVINKIKKLADELLKSKKSLDEKRNEESIKKSEIKNIFEEKGHFVENIYPILKYNNNDSFIVQTKEFKYDITFSHENNKLIVNSKKALNNEGFDLEKVHKNYDKNEMLQNLKDGIFILQELQKELED